ncbi:hypothetical protein NBRC116188_02370 [Oceaniserpentilla sp. 4NH20-0058]|uniref:DUF2069 domain-containing protein n=1 Tax=Oceaniserpentilla sp. 4NH20-0058 TaxID=3127660 RepID=UPI003103933C
MTKININYYIALTCFFLQFIILGISSFDRPDLQITGVYDVFLGILWTAIKGLPWLVLIPGLIMKTKNIMAWMSYVCLVYFIIWMLAVFGASGSSMATLGVCITLIQFITSAYYTRLLKRQ